MPAFKFNELLYSKSSLTLLKARCVVLVNVVLSFDIDLRNWMPVVILNYINLLEIYLLLLNYFHRGNIQFLTLKYFLR